MQIDKVIYPDLSYRINGILFSVHNDLGRFCNEKQYADAVENYLKHSKIEYSRELMLPPSFENEAKGRNKVDFIIKDEILLELKAKRMIEKSDYYQTKRYLKSLNKKLGILVNFRDKYIKPRRIINSEVSE